MPRRGTHRHQMLEVPALHPSEAEFADPIAYLSSRTVAALGNRFGMVKLVPPPTYSPPLSINKKKFRFVPRLQKLNELNLLNRCRLFFHRQLSNYRKTQAQTPPKESFEKVLGTHIYFYDFFIECVKYYKDDSSAHDRTLPSLAASVLDRDSGLWSHLTDKFEVESNGLHAFYRTHLLQYFNFLSQKSEFTSTTDHDENPVSLLQDDANSDSDEEIEEACLICHKFDDEPNTLLCDSCNKPYHRYCLSPPLSRVPKDSWCCDGCVIGNGYYGFKDAPIEYSLTDFHHLSDDFDTHFFKDGKPKDIYAMEKIFWSLVENTDNDVRINYGADIHNLRNGEVSGFPTKEYRPPTSQCDKEDYKMYANHPMNLNNLPFNDNSLLNYLDMDISGMTIPWIYIGNTFSTFCWHVEDQYTLSANYQHYGATKKWYSIPSRCAEKFETFMRELAPDLFAKQPDILHQLITLVSPYTLLENGIDCYTANQNEGEYIITYPRVYHAGFNAGYNFNEAVNFTMTEWLDYGVLASQNYRKNANKSSVFDIWELMISIIDSFVDSAKTTPSSEAQERKLVKKCLDCLKPRVEAEYSIQHTILDSLDVKPERWSSVKQEMNKTVVYANEEERKLAEDGISCAKCKGFCTFAFVKHYVPSSRTFLPTPFASPQSSDDYEDRRSRQSKRIKLLKTSEVFDTEILCLEDYLKLENPNSSKDEYFITREIKDVKKLIQEAEVLL